MNIKRLIVGPLACNCYLLEDEGAGAVIDPGGDLDRIIEQCLGRALEPRCIIVTHGHVDHIAAVPGLKRRFPGARLCVSRGDARLFSDPLMNLSAMMGDDQKMPRPDTLLAEGQRVEFGACLLRVVETPGHTPGSICLVAEGQEPPVVFCGDLIFQGDVGRTDLPGGSREALRRSIEEKIFTLPDETLLLPGHGESTSVGAEKQACPLF